MLRSGPRTTYRELFQEVGVRVAALFPRQHPQAQGNVDRVVFGASKLDSPRYVSVARREPQKATLDAGAVHGMTAGSRWAIYAEDAGHAPDDSAKAGVVEIVTVGVESEARILSEAGARRHRAWRARHRGDARLRRDAPGGPHPHSARPRGASERSWPSCSPSRSWSIPPAPTRPPT